MANAVACARVKPCPRLRLRAKVGIVTISRNGDIKAKEIFGRELVGIFKEHKAGAIGHQSDLRRNEVCADDSNRKCAWRKEAGGAQSSHGAYINNDPLPVVPNHAVNPYSRGQLILRLTDSAPIFIALVILSEFIPVVDHAHLLGHFPIAQNCGLESVGRSRRAVHDDRANLVHATTGNRNQYASVCPTFVAPGVLDAAVIMVGNALKFVVCPAFPDSGIERIAFRHFHTHLSGRTKAEHCNGERNQRCFKFHTTSFVLSRG